MAWSIIFDVAEYRPQELDRSGSSAGQHPRLRTDRGPVQAEILLPRDVRVPVRARARRTRSQLHHRRRDGADPPHARVQRAAPLWLGRLRPAGRECRDQERHPSRGLDLRQHRTHEGAAEAARHQLRLGPRARHLHARLLQVEPVAVHPDVRARAGLPPPLDGELVSGRSRCSPTSRSSTAPAGAAALPSSSATSSSGSSRSHTTPTSCCQPRHAHEVAREGRDDAAELDRAERGGARAVLARRPAARCAG